MRIRQVSCVGITNKARIDSRSRGCGITRGSVGIEQVQIHSPLKVTEDVFHASPMYECWCITVSCQKINSEGDVGSNALN